MTSNVVQMRIAATIGDILERSPTDVTTVLHELIVAAANDVPGAQYAGVTATDRRGDIDTATATGPYPVLLDDIQKRHHQGPCLQAALERQTVLVDDLSADIRWPKYRRDVLQRTPVRSVLSFGMLGRHDTMGSLSFFAEKPRAFDSESQDLGFVWAAHVAQTLDGLRRDIQLRRALASRDIIGQAKGMLMERYRIDASEAFKLLRQLSQESNTPLVEVARRLVGAENL